MLDDLLTMKFKIFLQTKPVFRIIPCENVGQDSEDLVRGAGIDDPSRICCTLVFKIFGKCLAVRG